MLCTHCEHLRSCRHQCMLLPKGRTCGDCTHLKRCVALFHGDPKNTSCGFEPIRFMQKGKEKHG